MSIIIIIIIYIVITSILSLKRGGAYFNKLTPTMKFIIAAGANTYQKADCSRVDVGGNPATSWAKRHMRKLLKSGWDVKSTDDLKGVIFWLFNKGHNRECMDILERYKQNPQFFENKKLSKTKQKNMITIMDTITNKFENQGILAWDLCRACNVAGWGFLARYITYEEAIQISVDACKILQNSYTSWDDMMESYFLGLWYWSKDSGTVKNRTAWYERSKKNKESIYNIPWDTVLSPEDVIPPRKK